MKLKDLAKTIRSKNAGVNHITFDIIFREREVYEKVKQSGVITPEAIVKLYKITAERLVLFTYFDPANAIKFSIRRRFPSGSMGETDIFGSQQYAPLFDLEIPN